VKVAELYRSLQGEGLLAGTPSTFLRTSGCNLRCRWCDTPFTSWEPTGDERSVGEVVEEIAALGCRHVVVTGGEPLLFVEVMRVCEQLRATGEHVTIETAGTVLPPEIPAAELADLFSISPKLASSAPPPDTPGDWHRRHEAARRRDDIVATLLTAANYQLKFVIDRRDDLDEVQQWLNDIDRQVHVDRSRVFLMPQGVREDDLAETARWLQPACQAHGFRFAPRHHLSWYGHTRGT
jgi:7-carboxy-7-deazaguanine synthase